MKNVEQEVKSWIEKKIIYIAFIAIFLLGIACQNYAAKVCIKGCPNIFASMV